jgi:hypothetical protein
VPIPDQGNQEWAFKAVGEGTEHVIAGGETFAELGSEEPLIVVW